MQTPSFNLDRLTTFVHLDGSDAEKLVLRTPAGLDPGAFTTDVGVVQLHGTAEQASSFLPGYGAVDFVVQQPSDWVAHIKVAQEDHGRDVGRGLADVMDRQNHVVNRSLVSSINVPAVSDI